ncbi:hypothetical protein B0H63DRAFT_403383 [Podospora didyma]|uniref:Arca-like protein n=1 Tax=Podospora didyma TaxID=330526 RepID=A0AAE0K5W6_9PEZI|nr:hypothetical protein B0H63DRAFT_403383 [Podospora didyma]
MQQIYLEKSLLPFIDKSQAFLFRHFVQKLAIWLDLCDPARSFETKVPDRAGNCPILLNAIFALSSRHLGHINNDNPQTTWRTYLSASLSDFQKLWDNHDAAQEAVKDENLFAAIIILRVLEEMDAKDTGEDNRTHITGIIKWVKEGDKALATGTLSAASFWVGLRQEIYSAVMTSETLRISLHNDLTERSVSETDNYTWANRAVVHCAEVLNFCFDTNAAARTEDRWHQLSQDGRNWEEKLPASCKPYFVETDDTKVFPNIWYRESCAVIGKQHHLLAELFLTHHNPTLSETTKKAGSHQLIQDCILPLVRQVCGIGLSNEWTPPSMFTACMVIEAFGDRFDRREDQEAMLEILEKTETDHLRPTQKTQQKMKLAWKWDG